MAAHHTHHFVIHEGQHVTDHGAGYAYEGTLTAAKRAASRGRVYQGTLLVIRCHGAAWAIKRPDCRRWINLH